MKAIELLEFLAKGFKDGELESDSLVYFEDCDLELKDLQKCYIDKDKDVILNENNEVRF